MNKILVVGSANVDFVSAVGRLPRSGETVHGSDLVTTFGGKGANQAVAAARLGGDTHFVGCLGSDASGDAYLGHLESEGIGVSRVRRSPRPSGCALIAVDPDGDNIIICAPGANQDLLPKSIADLHELVEPGDLLLLQFEIPMDTNVRVAEIARTHGARLLLNPSPAQECNALFAAGVDVMVLNEHEAARYLGEPDTDALARHTAEKLLERVREAVIVTRGSAPAWLFTRDDHYEIAPPPVLPVDTVGAGDTFLGALAVAIAESKPWPESVQFAHNAAALSTLSLGAQSAMPHRREVDARMRQE